MTGGVGPGEQWLKGRAARDWAEELGRAEGEETGRTSGRGEGERGSAGPVASQRGPSEVFFPFSFFSSFISKPILNLFQNLFEIFSIFGQKHSSQK